MADFLRIFGQVPLENATIFLSSEEGAQMWRYLLRLNSTKMVPSAWQKENIPLGENTSLLATLISPLYDEFQLRSGITTAMNTNSLFPQQKVLKRMQCALRARKFPQTLSVAAVAKPFFIAVPNASAPIGRNTKLFALQSNFQSVPS